MLLDDGNRIIIPQGNFKIFRCHGYVIHLLCEALELIDTCTFCKPTMTWQYQCTLQHHPNLLYKIVSSFFKVWDARAKVSVSVNNFNSVELGVLQ